MLKHAPTWSTLRTIGQSRVMSLTIIVPFVGYLILFNEHVMGFLTLWPGLFGGADAAVVRLYFVYFGLSALGLGQLLFVILCPPEAKDHQSASLYVTAESGGTAKKATILLWFTDVIEDYMINRRADQTLPSTEETRYPPRLEAFFLAFLSEVRQDVPTVARVRTRVASDITCYREYFINFIRRYSCAQCGRSGVVWSYCSSDFRGQNVGRRD